MSLDDGALPYQVERFDVNDESCSVAFLAESGNGVLEYRTLVFHPAHPALQPLVADLLHRMCGLIDEVKTVKFSPPDVLPGR